MMELLEAMEKRHSVRAYKDQVIDEGTKEKLEEFIEYCNQESGLHMQLVTEEPKAFDSFMAHYGKFSGVKNYIAVVGRKEPDLDEKCGYYGEKVVLHAQQLGLNTCWVASTYSKVKDAFQIKSGEKLRLVIAIGYGKTQGVPHKSKSLEDVVKTDGNIPEWFQKGVQAALLAPTAVNQQKFVLTLEGDRVSAKAGRAFYSKLDLGIVKYHFEIGSGKDSTVWK